MMNVDEIVEAILYSFRYNREDDYMLKLLDEVEDRVDGTWKIQWTDDGNILFGSLVLLFGDYGTSPRSGWVEDHWIKEKIKEKICEVRQTVERIKYERAIENEMDSNN